MIEYNGKKITAENITLEDIEDIFEFDKNIMLQHRLNLGKDYVNKQFPENIEQTSRVKKILARNIKLSDPKTFKTVKQPVTYHKMFGKYPKKKNINESNLKSIFVRPVSRNNLTEGLENYIGMVTFDKVKKYRKPLIEIDQKIDRLEEEMNTTGYYTQVSQNDGQGFIPPIMGPAPLGDAGSADFAWPDQGDGNPENAPVTSTLTIVDALDRKIAKYPLPGVIYPDGNERRDPDYTNFGGKIPLAILYDGRALASTRYFWLGEEGLNFIVQIGAYTTPGPYTPLQTAFFEWINDIGSQNVSTEPINLWGGLDCLFGQCYGGSAYYPAGTSNDSDPLASRALYQYMMYVPGTGNPNFATNPGQRSEPPRVTQIIKRTDLGDPNYYSGPVSNIIKIVKPVTDFGKNLINFIGGFGGGPGEGGGNTPPPPPPKDNPLPPPPPPKDNPLPPPPPPPEDNPLSPPPPPPEDDNDDRPLIPLGYDENGDPTGFTRMSPTEMEQFKDGGGDAAIREGKSLNQVMNQGYENRKNAFTDFTSGIGDGTTVLSQVQDTLTLNRALNNIEPSSDGGRPTIKEGERGSSTNPVQTNLSDSSMNALQNAVNNYDPRVDGDLSSYLNKFTSTSDNLGLKSTHNNIQGTEIRGDDIIIKDTYGFGPSADIYNKPVVKQVSDTAEAIVNALGGDGKGASEQVQTVFDQLGPLGAGAGLVASGGESLLPGKDDAVVHFETVIPGGAKNLGSNFQPMREETLFEKWKKKNQKKPESKPDQLKLIYNYFYYLPKMVKKMIIMDFEIEVQIMMLSPDEKVLREKELRNTLINKHHELYMDEKFPENKKQTSRVKKILARNIELSDPKTFKDVKQPATYGKVFGDDPKNKTVNVSDPNKKSAARFFKKPKPKTKDQVREERLEELRHLENTLSNK